MARPAAWRLIRVGKWALFIAGSALALSLLAIGVLAWRDEARVKTILAALVRQGEPVHLSQLAKPPIPDNENGAALYSQAFAVIRLSDEDAEFLDDVLSGRLRAAGPNVSSRSNAIVERNRSALALIHRASSMPRCSFPIAWEKGSDATFSHLKGLRQCARLAALESTTLAMEGRPDAAVDACGVIFRVADAADGPSLIQELVRYACIGIGVNTIEALLRDSAPSPAACRALAVRLAREDLIPSFVNALQGERVSGISVFEKVRSAKDPMKAMSSVGGWEDYGVHTNPGRRISRQSYFIRWLFASDEVFYLETMGQVIEAAPRPYREVKSTLRALDESDVRLLEPHVMSAMLLPTDRGFAARDRSIAKLGLARTALLLAASRAERGRYPESLAELERFTGQELPLDPFSGKPFPYRREGEGFILYSLGINLKDDGGTPPPPKSEHRDEGDVVFRCPA